MEYYLEAKPESGLIWKPYKQKLGGSPGHDPMRTSVGIWDAIFGNKVIIELPMPNGGVKRIRATERWVAEMQRQGRMKPVGGQTVKVHILDAAGGLGDLLGLSPEESRDVGVPDAPDVYRVEEWVIGRDISAEQYDELKDPKTGELFALISMKDGERRPFCLPRDRWLEAKRAMDSV